MDFLISQVLLSAIIKGISSSQDAVVEVEELRGELEFTVKIPKAEAGRVIGKYGDVIKSIRSVMYGVTMHQHRKKSNVVVEPY